MHQRWGRQSQPRPPYQARPFARVFVVTRKGYRNDWQTTRAVIESGVEHTLRVGAIQRLRLRDQGSNLFRGEVIVLVACR
jgi:hypothetical protein